MFSLKQLTGYYGRSEYVWVDAVLIKETKKAALIMFNGRQAWISKAWIRRIKRKRNSQIINIKISLYYRERKFG